MTERKLMTTNAGGPDRKISRRRLLSAVPGLVILAGGASVIACGDDDDEAIPTASGTAAAATTAAATTVAATTTSTAAAFPRVISHALGDTTIPALPTRIVAVNEGEALDHLLAVGLKPALFGQTPGYTGSGAIAPWALAAGATLEMSYQMARMEPDLERMAAANPDLIIGAWTPDDQYGLMAGIAPTILVKNADSTSWPEMQRLVGKATGREVEAEAALAETDRVIAAEAERLRAHRGLTVKIGYKFLDQVFMHGANTPIARLVERLGLTVVAPDPDILTELSMEQLGEFDGADMLLSPVFFPDDQSAFEASPLMRSLAVVQAGGYVPLPVDLAAAGYTESTLSVRWAIPLLADAVLQAAEGRGIKPA